MNKKTFRFCTLFTLISLPQIYATDIEIIRRGPAMETTHEDDTKLLPEMVSHSFTAGAGKHEDVIIPVDNDTKEIRCEFDVLRAHAHEKWASTTQIILYDKTGDTRIRFRVSLSVNKVDMAVVRVHRDDESLKPHYLSDFQNPKYVGKHTLVLRLLDSGQLEFEVDGRILEKHTKNFDIDSGEIVVVGTDVEARWLIK